MITKEMAYVERSGGRWELWTYSEGRRCYLLHTHDYRTVERYCRRHRYRLVEVK